MDRESLRGIGIFLAVCAMVVSILMILSDLGIFGTMTGKTIFDVTGATSSCTECGSCSCQGIRFVDLAADYGFTNNTEYTVEVEVFKGTGTNPSKLIDSEILTFSTLPQETEVDNNAGTDRGNIMLKKINSTSIVFRLHNQSRDRLIADYTFRVTIVGNSSAFEGPQLIHLSCSTPVDIGDVFGDFKVVDIDKILSGSRCTTGNIFLLSPANNSATNQTNITFAYSVFEPKQSIDYCRLYINDTVYGIDYSIYEIFPQFFQQNLSHGSYEWWVKCMTSNGYDLVSEKRILQITSQRLIRGVISESGYRPVPSSVTVYDSQGQMVMHDNETYEFYLVEGIYDIKIVPESGNFKELYIYNLTVNENIVNFTRLEDSDEDMPSPEFIENWTEVISWEVNPLAEFDLARINMSYGSASNLALWKCTDFDFNSQQCNNDNNWTAIQNLGEGPGTVVFYINSNDPAAAAGPGDKPPTVTLNYPPDSFSAYTNTTYNVAFNCTAEDKQGSNKGIVNISLYLTNNLNSSFTINETISYAGTNTEETAVFSKTLVPGNYTWNCLAYDNDNQTGWGENRSIEIHTQQPNATNDTTPPIVQLISPANNSIDADGYVTFYYNVSDNESDIDYCQLIINGSVSSTDYTITKDIPQPFTKTLSNGDYEWSVNCTNEANLNGSSKNRIITINITAPPQANATCCCGLDVSVTPKVVVDEGTALVAADLTNIISGGPAYPFQINNVTATIYRVENSTVALIIENATMSYIRPGLWYYEFFVGNNATGSYIASVVMETNQTPSYIKQDSYTFSIGESAGGLFIQGVSPDLINLNESTRVAAEVYYNGIPISTSQLNNATLNVVKLNGSTQTYTTSGALNVANGLIYLDGAFNESGVYYLNWTVYYKSSLRSAKEVVVVVDWGHKLDNLNISINITGDIVNIIKESRSYLIQLLSDMERLQQFNEEEVFLVTDSVNSMSTILEYLESGEITPEEAEQQFNELQKNLQGTLGDMTGFAVKEKESWWRKSIEENKMVIIIIALAALLLLVVNRFFRRQVIFKRGMKKGVSDKMENKTAASGGKVQQKAAKAQPKRRYQVMLENIRNPSHASSKKSSSRPKEKRRYQVLLEKLAGKGNNSKPAQEKSKEQPSVEEMAEKLEQENDYSLEEIEQQLQKIQKEREIMEKKLKQKKEKISKKQANAKEKKVEREAATGKVAKEKEKIVDENKDESDETYEAEIGRKEEQPKTEFIEVKEWEGRYSDESPEPKAGNEASPKKGEKSKVYTNKEDIIEKLKQVYENE